MTDATPPIDLPATIAKLRELAAKAEVERQAVIRGKYSKGEDRWSLACFCSPQTITTLCDAAARAEALKQTCIDNIAFHRKTVAALEAENARMREGLERIMGWRKPAEGWGEVAQICRIARAALAPQPTDPPTTDSP